MQSVVDFYAGFALFMLVSSLIGLAVLIFQPALDRFKTARRRPADRPPKAPRPETEHRLRPAA